MTDIIDIRILQFRNSFRTTRTEAEKVFHQTGTVENIAVASLLASIRKTLDFAYTPRQHTLLAQLELKLEIYQQRFIGEKILHDELVYFLEETMNW